MTSTLKWSAAALITFLVLGFGTHWAVAACLLGGPLLGLSFAWCFEKAFPHAYDSSLKDKD